MVTPNGVSGVWGAPEHVQSVHVQRDTLSWVDDEVDGPAADMWSSGVLIYSLVRGWLVLLPMICLLMTALEHTW